MSFSINGHSDLQKFILDNEQRYIDLMSDGTKEALKTASSLNCASVSFLIAHDIVKQAHGVQEVFTVDGERKGLTKANGHTVLGVKTSTGYSAIDGTVWQVFPKERHMRLIGPFDDEATLLKNIAQQYGGEWRRKSIPESFITDRGAEQNMRLIRLKANRRSLTKEQF